MFMYLIAAGTLASSIMVAAPTDEPNHDITRGSGADSGWGWVTLYSLSYFRGDAVDVEPTLHCSHLPEPVGSAVNNSTTQIVSFYPDHSCGGVPVIVEPGGKVEEFSNPPHSFDSFPPVVAASGS